MSETFVDPVTNPQGALSQMASAPMSQIMAQQQEDRTRRNEQLSNLQKVATRDPETDEAERWGAMASAAAKSPPVTGAFGMMLANIGGAYGQKLADQKEAEVNRQALLAKLMDSGALGAGSMTALTQALLNPYMNVPGVGLVRRTDASLTLPSNLLPEYNKLYSGFYSAAIEQKMPNPEEWAKEQAENQIRSTLGRREIAGGRAISPPPAEAASQDFDVKLRKGTDTSALLTQIRNGEARAIADQDFTKARELQALRQRVEAGKYEEAPSGLEYRDIPKAESEKAQADVLGKDLAKEATTLSTAANASGKMIAQLNTLEKLYKTPNIPEGELAPYLQKLRSGLSSLGVEMGKETGAADMANAIASNFALHMRTGEGENLLPGQMSNYEDQLLQKMSPTLSLTQEGRLALIDYMREMAKTNMRFNTEIGKMTDERGLVDPAWRKRKERVMKEEMARLTLKANDLQKRFGGE